MHLALEFHNLSNELKGLIAKGGYQMSTVYSAFKPTFLSKIAIYNLGI